MRGWRRLYLTDVASSRLTVDRAGNQSTAAPSVNIQFDPMFMLWMFWITEVVSLLSGGAENDVDLRW